MTIILHNTPDLFRIFTESSSNFKGFITFSFIFLICMIAYILASICLIAAVYAYTQRNVNDKLR
jgi:hypothetical protein